jgi:sugar phosphate isomerase/epimerase
LEQKERDGKMLLVCQEGLLPGGDRREKFHNAREYGFQGIEVGGRALKTHLDEYRALSREFGLPITSICLGWDGCILDADPKEREKAVAGMIELLRLGDEVGGANLIVPPIFGPPRISDLRPLKSAVELEYELLEALLRQIAKEVAGLKSQLLLEPLNRYEMHLMNRVEEGAAIARRVNSPNVAVMADFFHMSIEEADINAALRENRDVIRHVHLADSNRKLPGQGHMPYAEYFRTLREIGFEGAAALECGILGDPSVELPRCRERLAAWAKG